MRKKAWGLLMVVCMVLVVPNVFYAVDQNEMFDEEFSVDSDGAQLYLRVRGQDMNNPVLLYLHGGPGDLTGPLYFQAYAGPLLEKRFTVGYLHQRGTCKSPSVPPEMLTVENFIKDVDNVVSFLKKEFRKDRVFLIGHSFGGILGYLYLLEHGADVEKFVSAGGAFSTILIEEHGYQTVLELAQKAGDLEAVKKMESLGPPPYKTFQEGMAWRTLGMTLLAKANESPLDLSQISKVASVTGAVRIDEWMGKSMTLANAMWKELATVDVEDEVKNITTPLLIITGAKDLFVPFQLLKKGYENYGGEKEYCILEKGSHNMFVDEPDLFVSKVIEFFQK